MGQDKSRAQDQHPHARRRPHEYKHYENKQHGSADDLRCPPLRAHMLDYIVKEESGIRPATPPCHTTHRPCLTCWRCHIYDRKVALAPLEEAVVEMVSFLKTDMDAFDTEPPKVENL